MKDTEKIIMRRLLTLLFISATCIHATLNAQTYRQISGWPQEVNDKLESFLNSTITMNERKVSVFDGDGTSFGQVPYYLADEALYRYADEVLKKRNDSEARKNWRYLTEW